MRRQLSQLGGVALGSRGRAHAFTTCQIARIHSGLQLVQPLPEEMSPHAWRTLRSHFAARRPALHTCRDKSQCFRCLLALKRR